MGNTVARRVYVISDLHIGGVYGQTTEGRGFRLNTHVAELTAFVRTLAAQDRATGAVELVLNGDSVDFLAERDDAPPYWHPFTEDPSAACAKLQAIATRDQGFFAALRELLDRGHRLTILPGSHDLELVLPQVRATLREVIGVQAEHDYEFIPHGEAYVVGDALIEPGYRYDSFSQVTHDKLRGVCSFLSRRQPVPAKHSFNPPAASKMVSWVINDIKEDYKFIDLLKPATDVAVPVLLALEPGYRQLLATIAKLSLQARSHGMETASVPKNAGEISSGSNSGGPVGGDMGTYSDSTEETAPADEDEAALEEVLRGCLGSDAEEFLGALPSPGAPSNLSGGEISASTFIQRTIGIAKLLLSPDDQDVGRRLPYLLKALRVLQPDRSFDVDFESLPVYHDAADDLLKKGNFRFVVFGHTHRPKKIELEPGCWYLNTGAWSDFLRLPPEIITGSEEEALSTVQEFMLAIARNHLKGWVAFHPTYVRMDVDAANRVTSADVYLYSGPASLDDGAPLTSLPAPDTRTD